MGNFNVEIDFFRFAYNGTNIFVDTFSDGVPPPSHVNEAPSGPSFNPYLMIGSVTTETGGRAVLNSANAADGQPLGTDPTKTIVATVPTNIAPGGTLGFRQDRNFDVVARFDLDSTIDPGSGYGIRLSDVVLNSNGDIIAGGDDNVFLTVSKSADGSVGIRMVERNFLTATREIVGSAPLDPGGADQIVLRLVHTAGTGEIKAYYSYVTAGVTGPENLLPGSVIKIFDGEDYTRAQFFASSIDDIGAKLLDGDENDNTLNGTAIDEDIVGYAGNDTMFGNGGTDTVDGRAGNDTAKFIGNRADYVTSQVDATHVLVTGAEGSSTLTNVENLQFADGTLTLAQAVAPEVELRGNNVVIADGDATPGAGDDTAFGTVVQGTSVVHTFTLKNLGAQTLTIVNLQVPAGFTLLPGSPTSIASGASATFQVQLNTASPGSFSGNVTFTTNDADETAYNFAISGTVIGPEIELRGNNVVVADNDTTPAVADHTDFGTAAFGSTAIRTFTVFNNGDSDLTTSGLTAPAGFTIVEGLSGVIAAGQSDTFQIQLDTSSGGIKSGQITFTSDDADESAFNFAIRGNVATAPEIEVTGNGNVIADGDTTPAAADHTAFGLAEVGANVVHTFTVNNTGSSALTTSGLKLPKGFLLVEGLSPSIGAGSSDTFQVRLDTAKIGAYAGVISFTSNDADEAAFDFAVSGSVVASTAVPEITVLGNGNAIADGDTTPSTTDDTDFGTIGVGAIATHTFTVSNTGEGTLNISRMKLPKGFVLIEGLSAAIGESESDTFTVGVDTSRAGAKAGSITFTTNDPDETAFDFALAANVIVIPPEIEVLGNGIVIADNDVTPATADDTDFGSAIVGDTVIHTFTVNNTGDGVLNISKLKMPKGFVLVDGPSSPIAAHSSDTFQVRLDTTKAGLKTGTLSFTTNDPDETAFNFNLTGHVTAASAIARQADVLDSDSFASLSADAFAFADTSGHAIPDVHDLDARHGHHHHFDLV